MNVPFEYVALPAWLTGPTSVSLQPDGKAVTVNEGLVTTWLLTVTEKEPDDAPAGTTATIAVSLQLATMALTVLKVTVLVP